MDKIFEQLTKLLPPPFLVGLLLLGMTFFARYYAQGYRAYGDVLQDNLLRNAAIIIAAGSILFWLNSGSRIQPVAKPVLIVPFFVNDEHDQFRIALSSQIEERLNSIYRRNNTIFKLPSFLNDEETAKQVARRYGSAAVVYGGTIVEASKDSRSACFKLLKVEPEVYKTYSRIVTPLSERQQRDEEALANLVRLGLVVSDYNLVDGQKQLKFVGGQPQVLATPKLKEDSLLCDVAVQICEGMQCSEAIKCLILLHVR